MFAYLAGITSRIRFATGILVLPQRQTALVARQAADVDLLSGGRLRLGIGVGWNHVEYEALGQDFHTRGARQEEQIVLLRRLFTEPVVDFSGRFDRVDRAALIPKPTGSIPIWLGGSGDRAFDRAARLADGFIFFGGGVGHTTELWTGLRERIARAGRPVDGFGGDYVALTGGDMSELVGEVEVVAQCRRDAPVGGHHGPRPGFDRCPHRLHRFPCRASRLVVVTATRLASSHTSERVARSTPDSHRHCVRLSAGGTTVPALTPGQLAFREPTSVRGSRTKPTTRIRSVTTRPTEQDEPCIRHRRESDRLWS